MQRTDLNYRLELIPRWVRKEFRQVTCPHCKGQPPYKGFRSGLDGDEVKPCATCHGSGKVPVTLPAPPEISKAFVWHMQQAFERFWVEEQAIEEAYALKAAKEESLDASAL